MRRLNDQSEHCEIVGGGAERVDACWLNEIAPAANQSRRGFTLVEMMTTVAALVILLGLMVSLARDVRNRSANELTAEVLVKLDTLMADYCNRNNGILPEVQAVVPANVAGEEEAMRTAAWTNNEQFVKALRRTFVLSQYFGDMYDDVHLRDAWGNPIVFMAGMHPDVGMAPGGKWFFFSAGPDRRYLTREDNLYSYDRAVATTRSVKE